MERMKNEMNYFNGGDEMLTIGKLLTLTGCEDEVLQVMDDCLLERVSSLIIKEDYDCVVWEHTFKVVGTKSSAVIVTERRVTEKNPFGAPYVTVRLEKGYFQSNNISKISVRAVLDILGTDANKTRYQKIIERVFSKYAPQSVNRAVFLLLIDPLEALLLLDLMISTWLKGQILTAKKL